MLFSPSNFLKRGITEPLEFATFPYLTTENLVLFLPVILFAATKSLSDVNLVAPYKLIGSAALSVDNAITLSTSFFIAQSITFCAPLIFVLINSHGLYSAVLICFRAAACIIISTFLVAYSSLSFSLTSPMKILYF